MKYIISQRNNLYTEDNKVYYNGKMIEYEGDFEEAVLNKKVEIYRSFLSRHFDNMIVLTGAGSSFGIGKTEIKGMTMKKLWEEIVNKCGKESIESLERKLIIKLMILPVLIWKNFCPMPVYTYCYIMIQIQK